MHQQPQLSLPFSVNKLSSFEGHYANNSKESVEWVSICLFIEQAFFGVFRVCLSYKDSLGSRGQGIGGEVEDLGIHRNVPHLPTEPTPIPEQSPVRGRGHP